MSNKPEAMIVNSREDVRAWFARRDPTLDALHLDGFTELTLRKHPDFGTDWAAFLQKAHADRLAEMKDPRLFYDVVEPVLRLIKGGKK